jgi:beta-1,4-mannosyl-glycoprotein beta-1,4-N-acetylglucosaminyltransferase
MYKEKIFDCITFYDENLLVNSRFEILKDVVDYFIVIESNYDHKGDKKKINFKLDNLKFKKKVRHIIIEENFPNLSNGWSIEAFQREKILSFIKDATPEDYIMYSDSDEIPNPLKLKNLKLEKKYGIFLQKFFVYKLNIFNKYETPWQGTRICKKKYLKSITFLRKKIRLENLRKVFWKIQYEKSIQCIDEGGWHFNNLYLPEIISKKLKAFPHKEFSDDNYSSLENIKKKIDNLEDLFDRGHKYEKVSLDNTYPKYILENLDLFKNFIT